MCNGASIIMEIMEECSLIVFVKIKHWLTSSLIQTISPLLKKNKLLKIASNAASLLALMLMDKPVITMPIVNPVKLATEMIGSPVVNTFTSCAANQLMDILPSYRQRMLKTALNILILMIISMNLLQEMSPTLFAMLLDPGKIVDMLESMKLNA